MDALAMQCRVIYALMMREMLTRFGRDNIGFLWAVIEPLAFVAVLAAIRLVLGRQEPHGMPIVPFLMVAILPYLACLNTANLVMMSTRHCRPLLMLPGVTALDFQLSRAVLQVPTAVCTFMIAEVVMRAFDLTSEISRPLNMGLLLVVSVALGFGIGAIINVASELFPVVVHIWRLATRPLFFLSGLFFTASEVPEPFRSWLLWNPLMQITELSRSAYFAVYDSPFANLEYVLTWLIVTVFLGLLLERSARPYIGF